MKGEQVGASTPGKHSGGPRGEMDGEEDVMGRLTCQGPPQDSG